MTAIIVFTMVFLLLNLLGACCQIAVAGACMQDAKWLKLHSFFCSYLSILFPEYLQK